MDLPRILCLHGGGVNALVFGLQLRPITTRLSGHFRLVFLDGPFEAAGHSHILPFYGTDCGPYYRWLRWRDREEAISGPDAAARIMTAVAEAMEDDEGTGAWVGVLGFSQGAKIAASLLWEQERKGGEDGFKFGVLMAGSVPLVQLDYAVPCESPHISSPGGDANLMGNVPGAPEGDHVLSTPTLHVLGTEDPDIARHRLLRDRYCKAGTTRTVEWEGGHRLPFKVQDVAEVADEILELAEEAGVA